MKEGEQQASLSRSNTMTSQSLPTITRSATDLTSPTYDFNVCFTNNLQYLFIIIY